MTKIQIIENEKGERALVKKKWFLTFYRYAYIGEWMIIPKWYDDNLGSFATLNRELDNLKNNGEAKPKKVRKVVTEQEI